VGVGKLNHVAIAVPDLEQATSLYRDVMGAKVSEPLVRLPPPFVQCAPSTQLTHTLSLLAYALGRQALAEHGVTTVFIELGNTKLELLHPLGENSPIANFLKTKPSGGIHHICLEVRHIRGSICRFALSWLTWHP
jgi:methylmalonyl-CoA/ethylmalonyl-CoA epimerase